MTKPKYPKSEPVDLERMYRRPEPNPFTADWIEGYDAAVAGEEPAKKLSLNYMDGFRCGIEASQAELMDKTGSSNT